MKFIHIADLHLGAVPDGDRSWSEKRKQDLWDTFSEVIEKAEEMQADFLFIAGDLFHRQPLKRDLKEFRSQCDRLTRTKVLLIAGNHDHITPGSYYRSFDMGQNVILFGKEEMTQVLFEEQNTCVYGFSYWHKELREALLDGLHPLDPDRINILLAHAGDNTHVPFKVSALKNSGFDYVALGHIHQAEQMILDRVVMAGALEPINHTEYGPHGYWMGEITKEQASVQFIPVKKCEYVPCGIFVTPETTEREIYEKIREELREKESYQLLRIELEGMCDPELEIDREKICALDGIVDVSTERMVPAYEYEKLKEDYKNTLLSEYIRNLERRPQTAVTEKALYYGVDALCHAMDGR